MILPDRNEGDVEEIPEGEREGLEFVFVDHVEKALDVALEPRWKNQLTGISPPCTLETI